MDIMVAFICNLQFSLQWMGRTGGEVVTDEPV